MLSGLKIRSKYFKINNISKKYKFLTPERPWMMDQTVDELPAKGSELDFRLDSKRTYTKWFNPMTFDPRTPDYYETVRSDWREDVTRENFGMGNNNITHSCS
jgi:hypothetical protein